MRIPIGVFTPRKLLLGLALLSACSGEAPPSSAPTREACAALRDRLVAVRLASVTSDRAQHEANLRAALDADFVESCVATMAPDEVRCGIGAADGEALVACGAVTP